MVLRLNFYTHILLVSPVRVKTYTYYMTDTSTTDNNTNTTQLVSNTDTKRIVKRKGRPPKRSLKELKPNPVGRPKGTAAIINDYRDRMLNSPKSAKVLEAIFDAALDPDNKNQAAAWKLVIDRVAPISSFDVSKGSNGSMPQISINISGLSNSTATIDSSSGDTDDIEDVEDNYDNS